MGILTWYVWAGLSTFWKFPGGDTLKTVGKFGEALFTATSSNI